MMIKWMPSSLLSYILHVLGGFPFSMAGYFFTKFDRKGTQRKLFLSSTKPIGSLNLSFSLNYSCVSLNLGLYVGACRREVS